MNIPTDYEFKFDNYYVNNRKYIGLESAVYDWDDDSEILYYDSYCDISENHNEISDEEIKTDEWERVILDNDFLNFCFNWDVLDAFERCKKEVPNCTKWWYIHSYPSIFLSNN